MIRLRSARDQLLIENTDVAGAQWVFGRSAVTERIRRGESQGAVQDRAGPWSSGP